MLLETVFFLFGMGAWAPGLESFSVDPVQSDIAPIEEKWKFFPVINAKAAIIMERDSAQAVYEKNADMRLPMASLTKIMTAIIILENHDGDEVVTASRAAHFTDGASMKLDIDEKISITNLLHGLLIPSGNDAAVALAEYHSKDVYQFAKVMNKRVKSLRLHNTHFQNPHGFDSSNHYSSARDIAFLTKKLLQFPLAKDIVQTKETTVYSTNGKKSHHLISTNKLLGTLFPVYGVKTGTTKNAGQCLSLLIKGRKHEYIVVILGSNDRYLDAKTLIWRILLN